MFNTVYVWSVRIRAKLNRFSIPSRLDNVFCLRKLHYYLWIKQSEAQQWQLQFVHQMQLTDNHNGCGNCKCNWFCFRAALSCLSFCPLPTGFRVSKTFQKKFSLQKVNRCIAHPALGLHHGLGSYSIINRHRSH